MDVTRVLKASGAVLGMSMWAGAAMADCEFVEGFSNIVKTLPLLGGNLTVGRDVPLGTEIYRQTFQTPGAIRVKCSPGSYTIETRRALPITPLPLSSWSGNPWGGHVYQTGVPGIGVAVWYSGIALPNSGYTVVCGNGTAWCEIGPWSTLAFDFSFIKIGEVSPGTIQGSQLPTVNQSYLSSNALELVRINFSGSINIVSRTCSTPDVSVSMGTHRTSEFSGKNSYTAWKDFSVALNNCPAFNGYYQGTGPRALSDDSINNLESRKNNVLQVRLDPTQAAITPSLGIMSLNSTAAGTYPAASGVGLQIADSNGTPLPLATLHASGITPQAMEGASYAIPLKARYIQTEDRITAGPANATATFTINYY